MTKSNLELAKQFAKENNSTTSSRKSNLDYFHEILHNREVSRQDLVVEVCVKKLEDSVEGFDMTKDEHLKMFTNNLTKSKNMIDTSISNSNNNSSYSYNPKYDAFELKKLDNGNYTIVDKVEVVKEVVKEVKKSKK